MKSSTSSPAVQTKSAPPSSDETLSLHEKIFLDMTGHALSGLCSQVEQWMDAEDGAGDRFSLSDKAWNARNLFVAQRSVELGSLVTEEIFQLKTFSRKCSNSQK